jgi:hypothetical protein
MKKKILLLMLFCGMFTYSQNTITFQYDAAGNQIRRELCINCPSSSGRQAAKETVTESVENPLLQDRLSYYPNPVTEALTIQWGKEDEGHVQSISIYTIDGRQMSSVSNLQAVNRQTVPFLDFPSGMYIVVIRFDNKKEESIKIVKK